MSTAVFPTLVGLKWGVKKSPQWNTQTQRAASGKTLRATNYSAPIWHFSLSYEVLRADVAYNEIQTLAGFFNSRSGSFDSFYFTDPSEYSVTDMSLGVAVSSQLSYTFLKSWGGLFSEPIGALNGNPTNVKVDGVTKTLTTDYTVSGNTLTFLAQPTVGKTITWTGAFYYVVTFEKDAGDYEQFLQNLWQAQNVSLVSVKS